MPSTLPTHWDNKHTPNPPLHPAGTQANCYDNSTQEQEPMAEKRGDTSNLQGETDVTISGAMTMTLSQTMCRGGASPPPPHTAELQPTSDEQPWRKEIGAQAQVQKRTHMPPTLPTPWDNKHTLNPPCTLQGPRPTVTAAAPRSRS